MELTYYMWKHREIQTDLVWAILVLIPKVNNKNRGVGLLETLWKVVEAIVDTCLKACITFHGVLDGFSMGRGMGTAILELKRTQELSIIDHGPLFLVLLDLCKSYNTLDRGRLLATKEGYGAGTHTCGILAEFCEQQEVVTHQNGYHIPHLQAKMGTT